MAISIYQLKPKFQQLLRPLLQGLMRLGITPNQVTLFTLGLALAYGAGLFFCASSRWLWGGMPLFLLLRMALNAIDGMLANATGQKTALGALLNEICDQISDVVLYLPFALVAGVNAGLVVAVVVCALLAEFAGVLAPLIGVARFLTGRWARATARLRLACWRF